MRKRLPKPSTAMFWEVKFGRLAENKLLFLLLLACFLISFTHGKQYKWGLEIHIILSLSIITNDHGVVIVNFGRKKHSSSTLQSTLNNIYTVSREISDMYSLTFKFICKLYLSTYVIVT